MPVRIASTLPSQPSGSYVRKVLMNGLASGRRRTPAAPSMTPCAARRPSPHPAPGSACAFSPAMTCRRLMRKTSSPPPTRAACPWARISCPDNGARMNLQDCSITPDVGAPELIALWRDPDHNPSEHALYHARVLENPVCRWSTWDAIRSGAQPCKDLPATIQERAWSSPIWLAPNTGWSLQPGGAGGPPLAGGALGRGARGAALAKKSSTDERGRPEPPQARRSEICQEPPVNWRIRAGMPAIGCAGGGQATSTRSLDPPSRRTSASGTSAFWTSQPPLVAPVTQTVGENSSPRRARTHIR